MNEKTRGGTIPIERETFNVLLKKSHTLAICYCLCCDKARYKNGQWTNPKNLEEIKLDYGQFIYGRISFSEELDVNQSTVYRNMRTLERMGIIEIENHNNQFSIITVLHLQKLYRRNQKARENGGCKTQME